MLSFQLDQQAAEPLYEQIYNTIKNYIMTGTLSNGTKLPSTRILSTTLNVSRNTVDTAYYQLLSEGFIESRPKSGFYVCDISASYGTSLSDAFYVENNNKTFDIRQTGKDAMKNTDRKNSTNSQNSCKTQNASPKSQSDNIPAENNSNKILYDFSPFAVDISHFPYTIWKRLSKQSLDDEHDLFLLGENKGDYTLRSAICNYVQLSREVKCTPEQIIVGAGADYLLQMLSLMFRHIGIDEITMENPCYMKAARIFKNNDITLHYGILDEKGLMVSSVSEKSHAVYVTPSHEYPLGIVMPFGRRKELLHWANTSSDHYIIEDDHDSEFRYRGKPIPSLQGIDNHHKVIYIGTFSKAVAPAIRVAYMILPEPLLSQYDNICGQYTCTVSRLDQAILTRFLSQGYFEKHVNRMRKIYKAKHDTALELLQPYIDSGLIGITGENAGLHLVMTLPESMTEEHVFQTAKKHGIRIYKLKEHYQIRPDNAREALLLGYSNLSLDEIHDGLELFLSKCIIGC